MLLFDNPVDKSEDTKKESLSSGEYMPNYKHFDKLVRDQVHNHSQSNSNNRNSEYDEEELDRTEDELVYEDQESDHNNILIGIDNQRHRQGLLKAALNSINKSASTSSIHTSPLLMSPHISATTATTRDR